MDYQDFHQKVKEISDEELSQILIHANEEYKKRQNERYEKVVQRQLEVTKELRERTMYMDFSDTEEEYL